MNNCAAALVLLVRHFTKKKKEVIISRGELVQIGGGFRIGEILEASGAHLREVGATNKTTLDDYACAISSETAFILRVHQSNFFMSGFADAPPNEEIAGLARRRRTPFVVDLGSGALVATEKLGLAEHEPTPAEALKRGADLVCFSGDKLCGGPQAGVIAGKSRLVAALKREPLFRALRCDKLIFAALEATVDAHLRKDWVEIPVLALLQTSIEDLRARADVFVRRLAPLKLRVVETKGELGGGTLPRSILHSIALEITSPTLSPNELAARLRLGNPAIVGYVVRGKFRIDLRTVFPAQDEAVRRALAAVGLLLSGGMSSATPLTFVSASQELRPPMQHLILATAGHVDHGKTALVKALTGIDTDRLPEEKARGITIDLGFAQFTLPGFSLGIIDVPGHEDFIRNMIAGIGSIDLALLVVAADDGWMAQTEEHLQILDYLAVKHGVIAITKSDLADAAQVAKEARSRLHGTSLGEAPIVTTSVRDERSLQLLAQTLARVCANVPSPRDIGKPRLFVDRSFSVRGAGTIVTGTLTGGRLSREEVAWLQPQNKPVRIRALQNHNQQVESVSPGMRGALNLPDLQPNDIPRGGVITGTSLPSSRTLDVLLRRSDRLGAEARPLKNLSRVQVHYGSARFSARVTLLDRRELLPGENGIARLGFEEPIFAFLGDRFILRDSSARRTIAGGLVIESDAERIKFRSPAQRDLLTARAVEPNDLEIMLRTQLRRDRIIRSETLLLKSNISREEIADAVDVLVRAGVLVQRGEFTADKASWEAIMQEATRAIDDQHAVRPNELGLELPELRRTLAITDPHLFEALLAVLCERDFERHGNAIHRRTHRLSLPPQLQRIAAEIQAALAADRFDPPSLKELAKAASAQEALRFLCASGEAVRINDEVALNAIAFDEMKGRVVETLRTRGEATASELRQALGTSRRVLIPLLEYLDRLGLTIRAGDRRALRKL